MLLDQVQPLLRSWETHLRCEPYSFCLQALPEFVIRTRALMRVVLSSSIFASVYMLRFCLCFAVLNP